MEQKKSCAVNIDEIDAEAWANQVHAGPCCSHPREASEHQEFGSGPSGRPRYLDQKKEN